MMGASPYKSRNDLLREKATGITPEIDANTQALFDAGHAAEAEARKIVEGHLKAPLLPITCTDDAGYLLASFDGINEELHVGWECKLWNEGLASRVRQKELDPAYYWQLEHQAIVGHLEYIIFTCSDGTPEKQVHMKYVPVPGRAEKLLAGWQQFERDLNGYQPVEVLPPATAAPVMALPALSIQVNGSISLTDNLAVFGDGLKKFIEHIPAKPSTDQEFVDCKEACKKLQEAQDALDAGEAHALGQISSFDAMRRTKALLWELARNTRLAVEKMVAAREVQIKSEIVAKAKALYEAHVESLKEETGGPWIVISDPDFAGAIKGKRTIESLQNAVDTALANGKIAADASAKGIRANLACIKNDGAGYEFLFNDKLALIGKPLDDLKLLIKSRIDEHKKAETARLEAERERIRKEEQAKAEREARAKIEAEERARREQVQRDFERNLIAQPETTAAPPASPSVASAVHAEPVRAAAPIDPILDREGLIRSFMETQDVVGKPRDRLANKLREFCTFCDKFKTERRAA